VDHPYCYPGTDVYRNKEDAASIKGYHTLDYRPMQMVIAGAIMS
jgi:hypothetical protein